LQLKRLDDSKIEYKGKRILVISGGPGIFAKKLAEFSEVVVTEYSPETVNQMKTELGLNVVKFDYKTDRIEDVVEGKFDFIYMESSINFCEDQEGVY
jgi:2-polyprenyl-3-methyl-5-hydroxy-6-metoxy-1,4-benzoquinol methylase